MEQRSAKILLCVFAQVVNSRHLIYECRNVVQVWNIVSATLNFDVS